MSGGHPPPTFETGAWLQALVAGAITIFGRNAATFQGVTLLWVALTLLAVAGLTRSVRAVALAAQIPALVVLPRGGWIHSPEAALALAMGWLLVGGSPSRWSGAGASQGGSSGGALARAGALALLGSALVLLRPSGVLWVGVAALALLRPWRAANVGVLLVWALAAIPAVRGLSGYATAKVGLLARYTVSVPDLLTQVPAHLGVSGLAFVVLGIALRIRGARPPYDTARITLITGWLVLPLVASAITGAGLDNFPLFFAALVLVAAPGSDEWGTTPQRVVTALVVAGWLGSLGVRLASATETAPTARERVVALLDATCPGRSALASGAPAPPGGGTPPCVIIVDQGLFHPFAEDDTLELYLAGEDRVRLVPLHQIARAAVASQPPTALITWDCGARNDLWRQRFPTNDKDRLRVVKRYGLTSKQRLRAEGCELVWMTP